MMNRSIVLAVCAAAVLAGCGTQAGYAKDNKSRPGSARTYAMALKEIGQRLARSPIPVYLPLTDGKWQAASASVDASYLITQRGYSVTIGFGPKTPLPLNSPKATFGNAELLMIVRGAAPGGSLQLSQWIPLPKATPIPGAAEGAVDLGHGIVGTTFVGATGTSTLEAVTWREGGWTFWVGPWAIDQWGSAAKVAAQQAAQYLHTQFPGTGGIAVFAGGQDVPSEAVFSIGANRYAVLALGWRAPQFAATMIRQR